MRTLLRVLSNSDAKNPFMKTLLGYTSALSRGNYDVLQEESDYDVGRWTQDDALAAMRGISKAIEQEIDFDSFAQAPLIGLTQMAHWINLLCLLKEEQPSIGAEFDETLKYLKETGLYALAVAGFPGPGLLYMNILSSASGRDTDKAYRIQSAIDSLFDKVDVFNPYLFKTILASAVGIFEELIDQSPELSEKADDFLSYINEIKEKLTLMESDKSILTFVDSCILDSCKTFDKRLAQALGDDKEAKPYDELKSPSYKVPVQTKLGEESKTAISELSLATVLSRGGMFSKTFEEKDGPMEEGHGPKH